MSCIVYIASGIRSPYSKVINCTYLQLNYRHLQKIIFSMPRLISGINFHLHFVNQFHLFMLTSIHPSVLHSPHPSPLHSFTVNSKLTFLVNLFPHRSPTIEPRTDFLG